MDDDDKLFDALPGVDAATPRSKPFHIPAECPQCSTTLVLHDMLHAEATTEVVWYDEWACPKCDDGIYHDWPPEEAVRELASRAMEAGIPLNEVFEAIERTETDDNL